MSLSYYADRANLQRLQQQHPQWSCSRLASTLTRSVGWVKKWRSRLRQELAQGLPLEQVLGGHSRARTHPPTPTAPWVVDQVLAIRDAPPEGLRRVPGAQAIHYYLPRDPAWQLFGPALPSRRTIYRILKAHGRIPEHASTEHRPPFAARPHERLATRFQRCLQRARRSRGQATTCGGNPGCDRYGHLCAA